MNIFAGNGDLVRYVYPDSGHDSDQEIARKHLIFNQIYTVDNIKVYSSSSYMTLKEFPDIIFNPVMFEDVQVNEVGASYRAAKFFGEL